jgi:hypothetical protein
MTGKKIAKEVRIVVSTDPDDQKARLKRIGGSRSDNWNNILAGQALHSLWLEHSGQDTKQKQLSATLAALMGIGPNDELEGMIAAQLIAAHNATMECYRRAMLGEQSFEGRRENLAQANKLSRTFATLLEGLNRHRGKGQQKVTVEHVHIHSVGQAVVGVVEPAGDGKPPKLEDQRHAKQLTDAPEQTVWCTDTPRHPMPVAGDAERSMPDTRRSVAGRAQGE